MWLASQSVPDTSQMASITFSIYFINTNLVIMKTFHKSTVGSWWLCNSPSLEPLINTLSVWVSQEHYLLFIHIFHSENYLKFLCCLMLSFLYWKWFRMNEDDIPKSVFCLQCNGGNFLSRKFDNVWKRNIW